MTGAALSWRVHDKSAWRFLVITRAVPISRPDFLTVKVRRGEEVKMTWYSGFQALADFEPVPPCNWSYAQFHNDITAYEAGQPLSAKRPGSQPQGDALPKKRRTSTAQEATMAPERVPDPSSSLNAYAPGELTSNDFHQVSYDPVPPLQLLSTPEDALVSPVDTHGPPLQLMSTPPR